MFCGEPPFYSLDSDEVIETIQNPETVWPIPEGISPQFRSFLMLCWDREPTKRPSAAQLLEHDFVKFAYPSLEAWKSRLLSVFPNYPDLES